MYGVLCRDMIIWNNFTPYLTLITYILRTYVLDFLDRLLGDKRLAVQSE